VETAIRGYRKKILFDYDLVKRTNRKREKTEIKKTLS